MEWLDRDSFTKLPKLLIKRWSVEISQVGNSPRWKYREVLNFRGGRRGDIVEILAQANQRIKSLFSAFGGSYRKYVKNLGLGHFH